MARTLRDTINISTSNGSYVLVQEAVADSQANPAVRVGSQISKAFTNGTGINQVQRWWQSEGRVLGAGADEDIDVFDFGTIDIGAGAGLDQLGQSLALTGAKILVVENTVVSAGGTLVVGGEGSAAAWNSPFAGSDTATITLEQGGVLALVAPTAAGYAIADTSNHLLTIAAPGATATYNIYIGGI